MSQQKRAIHDRLKVMETENAKDLAMTIPSLVPEIRGMIPAMESTSMLRDTKLPTLTTDSQRYNELDRRARNEENRTKRLTDGNKSSVLPAGFAEDEIAAEDRKPKRKVAVMVGYSGTGYKGMQM